MGLFALIIFHSVHVLFLGFPGGSVRKDSSANAGDVSWVPGLGRSPGGGNGNPLQYCLRNPLDRGACRATVHGVAKSWVWRSNWGHAQASTHMYHFYIKGKTSKTGHTCITSTLKEKNLKQATHLVISNLCLQSWKFCLYPRKTSHCLFWFF